MSAQGPFSGYSGSRISEPFGRILTRLGHRPDLRNFALEAPFASTGTLPSRYDAPIERGPA
jgi:hypothetical protein